MVGRKFSPSTHVEHYVDHKVKPDGCPEQAVHLFRHFGRSQAHGQEHVDYCHGLIDAKSLRRAERKRNSITINFHSITEQRLRIELGDAMTSSITVRTPVRYLPARTYAK